MTQVTILEPQQLPTPYELGAMSTQQLREKLAQSLTMTARHLQYLAILWAELEKRGEDLSDLRTGLAVYMPQIAAGRLDAEAVIRFAGQPTVLRSVAMLAVDEQRAIAQGKPVRVLTANAEGEYEAVELPAYTLTVAQARMVFDGDKIRSPQEQRAMLESARVRKTSRVKPGAANKVRYDPKTDVIRIGKVSATVGEITAALAEAARQREQKTASAIIGAEEELSPTPVLLSKTERAQIKIRAAEAGMTQQDYTRAMLTLTALL